MAVKKTPKRNQMGLLQFKLQITEAPVAAPVANKKILSDDKERDKNQVSRIKRIK